MLRMMKRTTVRLLLPSLYFCDALAGTSAERFELKAPDNPPAIKRGPYRVYVHLHEARDMRSSSDPAKRHKFPEPVRPLIPQPNSTLM